MTLPNARAVMNSRIEPPDSLEFFPTPPWATRAFLNVLLHPEWLRPDMIVRCPAAGEGHMAEVIRDYGMTVLASDVHDYGVGYGIASYVGEGPDVLPRNPRGSRPPDWVIENPPFSLAGEFLARALSEARRGVALLVRTAWFHGVERYASIFADHAPSHVFHYAERVPMQKGWWDPNGSTATDYSWAVWTNAHWDWAENERDGRLDRPRPRAGYEGHWIPPGQREALTLPGDAARFPDRRSDDEKRKAAERAAARKAARAP